MNYAWSTFGCKFSAQGISVGSEQHCGIHGGSPVLGRRTEIGSIGGSILEIAVMPNLVDLTLCSEARRTLHRILAQRGLGFFLMRSARSCARLDSRRIAWVVKAAARRSTKAPQRDPNALSRTRRVLRRELIRRLAESMVEVGL